METYLARADRVIAHAVATIACQERQLAALRASGRAEAVSEAKAALALMLERLEALRANRRLVQQQITHSTS